jgi:PrgI family protein
MAQYKVLQDIEAEDKLVGPLTLRQFIYAAITAVCAYCCFICITKHLLFALPIFLLPGALTGFFAYPWARDQPTEIWALAKIRFLFKPRKRTWNQSGVRELVTVTAPKKIDVDYTNGLSPTEVTSRLKALADTIDTRGWAIKNVSSGIYAVPGAQTDRLIDISMLPPVENRPADDTMDDQSSAVAQTFNAMMQKSSNTHRQQIMASMTNGFGDEPEIHEGRGYPRFYDAAAQEPLPSVIQGNQPTVPSSPPNNWFLNQPQFAPYQNSSNSRGSATTVDDIKIPSSPEEEKELASRFRAQNNSQQVAHSHLHTILPLSEQKALAEKEAQEAAARTETERASVTHPPDPAIIALASNNDLNVATIARQANKQNEPPPDEVVISLH